MGCVDGKGPDGQHLRRGGPCRSGEGIRRERWRHVMCGAGGLFCPKYIIITKSSSFIAWFLGISNIM